MDVNPIVELIEHHEFLEVLKEKNQKYYKTEFSPNTENAVFKCMDNIEVHSQKGYFSPLIFHLDHSRQVFLQVCPEKFESNEDKKNFIKEIHFLRKIELSLYPEGFFQIDVNSLSSENASEALVLMPIFILPK